VTRGIYGIKLTEQANRDIQPLIPKLQTAHDLKNPGCAPSAI